MGLQVCRKGEKRACRYKVKVQIIPKKAVGYVLLGVAVVDKKTMQSSFHHEISGFREKRLSWFQ